MPAASRAGRRPGRRRRAGPTRLRGERVAAILADDSIEFAAGSAEIAPESAPVLAAIRGGAARPARTRRWRSAATPTSQGSESGNQRLSQERAEAVLAALRADGPAAARPDGPRLRREPSRSPTTAPPRAGRRTGASRFTAAAAARTAERGGGPVDRNELTLAIAAALVAAFLLGWILRWFFGRLNAGRAAQPGAHRRLATQLHAAEEAQHRAEARLAEVEADLRQRLARRSRARDHPGRPGPRRGAGRGDSRTAYRRALLERGA